MYVMLRCRPSTVLPAMIWHLAEDHSPGTLGQMVRKSPSAGGGVAQLRVPSLGWLPGALPLVACRGKQCDAQPSSGLFPTRLCVFPAVWDRKFSIASVNAAWVDLFLNA